MTRQVYSPFIRFVFPLALTALAFEFGGQVLNGGLARMPGATQTLAAFGLAWAIKDFVGSPIWQARQLGLVLVDNHHSRRRMQALVLFFALPLTVLLFVLGLAPPGRWLVRDLHGIEGVVGELVLTALLWLAPMPVLEGQLRFYSGLLLAIRRADIVSFASIAGILSSIAAVFVLVPWTWIHQRPIFLPISVIYVGFLVNGVFTVWGYRARVRNRLTVDGQCLSLVDGWNFFWPLALVLTIQGLSRPLINFFVSRGNDATEALAVLAVVYPLGILPYGWINELRTLPAAFRDSSDSLPAIRCFIAICGGVGFSLSVLLFWTPMREYILIALIGLDPGLANRCREPMLLLPAFPLLVTLRAYVNGIALRERRTRALAPSAPLRIGAIALGVLILPTDSWYGATLGILALLCGFVVEAAVMWWAVIGRGQMLRQ